MYSTNMKARIDASVMLPRPLDGAGGSTMHLSTPEDAAEALAFLASRPIHTVNLRGYIRDNGLNSPLNRGSFYGYRNAAGMLEGVALIGHATLVEAHTDRAMEALAGRAQQFSETHLIMGEQERVEEFWNYYSEEGQQKRLACRESLFELRSPVEVRAEVPQLRPATIDELDLILPVQAAMAEEESGVNPLLKDPEGFRRRAARRIEQGRVWVLVEDGRLIFKTDIYAETPEVIYLEGIYVNVALRSQGHGLRCLSQLSRTLLQRTESLCLLVNEDNAAAHAFYGKAGFRFISTYDTIFLQKD
jgi:predicted GNAT family acetyltransferase